jgi:hypothetical protein
MDFQSHLQNTWRLIIEQPLLLLLGGMLIQLLIVLSLGILAGPLTGGFVLMMITNFRDGRRPEFNDLFSGLPRFLQLFPFFFLGLLVMAGFFFFIIPGVIFSTWWLYTLPLMADRQLSLGTAMRLSHRKVREKGFFLHLVFLFMITVVPSLLISAVAVIIPPLQILHFFLFPAQCALLTSLYLEQFGRPGKLSSCPGEDFLPAERPFSPPPDDSDARRGLD